MEYWQEIEAWKDVDPSKWSDWVWQLGNTIRSYRELNIVLGNVNCLNIDEAKALDSTSSSFGIKMTPYLVATINKLNRTGNEKAVKALISAFVPSAYEVDLISEGTDGIGEEVGSSRPAPLVTNFYKNRVLLFVSDNCAAYCRYCFRRRKVGDYASKDIEKVLAHAAFQKSLQYIKDNQEIREVILSGGDPLILSDERLLSILSQLREIEHVKVLRIDTKVLTTLPQRITKRLVKKLELFKPIYIVGNFLHPAELTDESETATSMLIDAGIPVLSHTALLKDINDDSAVIQDLMWKLYEKRITPYYLIQFIPTKWTEHFRVPIEKGLDIMKDLHGRLSGIANPTYIVYLPDGAGKVPILPNYQLERTDDGYYFKNYEGRRVLYREPRNL